MRSRRKLWMQFVSRKHNVAATQGWRSINRWTNVEKWNFERVEVLQLPWPPQPQRELGSWKIPPQSRKSNVSLFVPQPLTTRKMGPRNVGEEIFSLLQEEVDESQLFRGFFSLPNQPRFQPPKRAIKIYPPILPLMSLTKMQQTIQTGTIFHLSCEFCIFVEASF